MSNALQEVTLKKRTQNPMAPGSGQDQVSPPTAEALAEQIGKLRKIEPQKALEADNSPGGLAGVAGEAARKAAERLKRRAQAGEKGTKTEDQTTQVGVGQVEDKKKQAEEMLAGPPHAPNIDDKMTLHGVGLTEDDVRVIKSIFDGIKTEQAHQEYRRDPRILLDKILQKGYRKEAFNAPIERLEKMLSWLRLEKNSLPGKAGLEGGEFQRQNRIFDKAILLVVNRITALQTSQNEAPE